MRGLVYIAALVLIMIVVSRMLQAWRAPRLRPPRRDELVKDPVCQTYVLLSRAVTTEANGVVTHFCSRECAARFAQGQHRR
jgi:YHS domain-containing protein